MPHSIRIRAGDVSVAAELNDSPTAAAILAALPIEASGNRWGEEIYFSIPVQEKSSPDARADMEVGELAYWPPGGGELPAAGPTLSDRALQITTFKRAEEGDDLIVRLFEPTGRARKTTLSFEPCGLQAEVQMDPFEIKTLRIDRRTGRFDEVDLLEE